jgi:hypothetical protein
MPIRLNLLAEAQAAEEARQRDPARRAIWLGLLGLALILVWSSSLQLKAMLLRSDVTGMESRITSYTNEYRTVLEDQKKIADIKQKLEALRRLAANRLLNGTLLNALQQSTVDDVHLIRLRLDQSYVYSEGSKTRTNEDHVVIRGKLPTATEKTMLKIEGIDSSANAGSQWNRYKQSLTTNAYFQQVLIKTNGINLKNLAPPQISPLTGKQTVVFTLECLYPDVTR